MRRKCLSKALSWQSSEGVSLSKAAEASSCGATLEASLRSWVRKHEPHASKKATPQLESRQKKKVEETNRALAPASMSAKLLTVAEAAWRLSLSEKTIRRMIEAGELAVIRIGRSVRIHPEVIEKIMRQNE